MLHKFRHKKFCTGTHRNFGRMPISKYILCGKQLSSSRGMVDFKKGKQNTICSLARLHNLTDNKMKVVLALSVLSLLFTREEI